MAFLVDIAKVVRETGTRHPREMAEALTSIGEFRDVGNYFRFIPSLEEIGGDAAGAVAGAVLCDLAKWCRSRGIPELNMLLVRKDTGLPGSGIMDWYQATFGTLEGYQEYCELHAKLAKLMLEKRLVEIVP